MEIDSQELPELHVDDPNSRRWYSRLIHSLFHWPWKNIDYIECILYAILGAAQTIVFSTHLDRDIVQNDTKRYPIIHMLQILCPIASAYCIIMLKLKSNIWINLFMLIVFIILPLAAFVSIIITNRILSQLSLSTLCIFSPTIAIGMSMYKIIRKIILTKLNRYWGKIVIIAFLIVLNVFFNLLCSLILVSDEFVKHPELVIGYSSVVYLVILCIIWLAIHSFVFKKEPNEIQALRQQIIDMPHPSLVIQTLLNKYPRMLDVSENNILSNYGHLIASIAILVSVLGIEIGLVNLAIQTNEYSDNVIYMAIFYILAVPVFIFGGIVFSTSILQKNDKFCLMITLVILLPTFFVMWISYYLYTSTMTSDLGLLIGVGFPASIVYWLSMTMIYDNNKRSYQYFSAICCLVAVFPLGLMWPLYDAGGMKSTTFWIITGIMFFGGAIVLFVWMAQFIMKLTKGFILLIKEVKSFNGFDLSLYLYSVTFTFGFCLLAWIGFKRLDYKSDTITGLIPGCFTILGLSIISTLVVHRITLYIAESDEDEASFRDIILNSVSSSTQLQLKLKTKKKKYQAGILIIGIAVTAATAVPILATDTSELNVAAGVTIIVGAVIIIFISMILIELKSIFRQFGEVLISYSLGCCWIFCLIPIVCLIPVSLASTQSDEQIRSVTSWSIGTLLIIFMVGVSAASITLNYLFKRMEYEKIAKYCCSQVQAMLTENGVRSKLNILRSIYDNFKISGKDSITKVLKNSTVFHYLVVNESDPDLRFSKDILTLKEISKRKNSSKKEIVEISQETTKGLTLKGFCKKLCTNKAEEEKVNVKEFLEPEELIGLSQIENSSIAIPVIKEENLNKNWDEQFKDNIKRQEDREKTVFHTIVNKLDDQFYNEEFPTLEAITEVHLKKKTKQELMNSKHLQLLVSSPDAKRKWLRACFSRFSSGLIQQGGEPWMTLSDLRHFIRLSGLKPYISYAACDILYIRLTRIYDPSTYSKRAIKLDFNQFLNALLRQLGKLRFPALSYTEAEDAIFREEIYPNLVSNLPYLYQYYPDESSDGSESPASISSSIRKAEMQIIKVPSSSLHNDAKVNPDLDQKIFESQEPLGSNPNEKRRSIYIRGHTTFLVNSESPDFFCSKFLDRFSRCIGSLFGKLLTCMGKCFTACVICLMPTSREDDERIKPIQEVKPVKEILERRSSPEWEIICDLIVKTFQEADHEARKTSGQSEPKMQLNLSNFLGIISHLSEIYSFSSIGFSTQVGWVYGSSFSKTSSVVLADNGYWVETFWVCFSCCLLFILCVIPASKYIKKGRLGLNEDFTIAGFPSLQFFLTKFIGLFGNTMYFTIMSALLSSFSCIYEDNQWRLMRSSSIICFENDHSVYFILAIIALLVYYPLATLLYPNIAYQDKALDLKYDTTYLVLESQGKLLIAAFAAFFAKEKYIWLQLIVSIGVALFLFLCCIIMKPCLIKPYNLWKTGGFIAPIWICSCALLNYYSSETLLALVLLVSGLAAIIGILLVIQAKLYGFDCLKSFRHIKTIAVGKDVISDSSVSRNKMEISNIDIES